MSTPSFTQKELRTIKNLATVRVNNCMLTEDGDKKCMVCKKLHPNEDCSVSTAEGVIEKLKSIK